MLLHWASTYRPLVDKHALCTIQLQGGAAGTSFVMPSADAWAQFEADAAKQKVNLTDSKLEALFSYLLTTAPITAAGLNAGTQVPMNLADSKKARTALCPKGTNASIVFAADTSSQLPAMSDTATARGTQPPAAPASAAAYPSATGAGAGAGTAYPGAAVAPSAAYPGMGAAPAAAAYPSAGPAYTAGSAPAAAPATAPGLGYGRKLAQDAPSGGLLLPTTFVNKPDPATVSPVSTATAAVGESLKGRGQMLCCNCV